MFALYDFFVPVESYASPSDLFVGFRFLVISSSTTGEFLIEMMTEKDLLINTANLAYMFEFVDLG